ncbi:type I secretion system permease/ATPase [Arcobacteraceae bacterium]|nr:type I secretion system permease/ATPase [Arcobacteraceae bacterium]
MNNQEIEKNVMKERRTVDSLLESLYFISLFYQRHTSKDSLVSGLPIHNNSMKINDFIISSKRIGLISKVVSRNLKGISKLALPAVLILEKDRACVLLDLDFKKNKATVIIPGLSEGEILMDIDALEDEFTEKVIIIKPTYKFENKVSNEIVIPQPKQWFWGALKSNMPIYRKVIVAAIFINLFVLAMPLFMKNVFDRVLPNNAIETLLAMTFGIVFILVFDLIFSLLRAYYLGKAGKKADLIMSNRIFDQLLNIRLSEKPNSTGQFVSRLQSFQSVRDFFTSATIATLVDIPFTLLFIAIIFYFGGVLGWISVGTIILVLLLSWSMKSKIKLIVEKSAKEEQLKQTTLNETVAGLEIIKSIRAQNRMKSHWDESLNQTLYYGEKSQMMSQFTTLTTALISKLSNIAIIVVGVYLSIEGDMSMGGIIAAMMLNGRVIAPISQIVSMVIRYDQTTVSMNNIDEIMMMEVEKSNKNYISRPHLNGDIEFKEMSFSYKGQNFETLKNINLTIKQGEKVAILGRIGSGKSTLAKLIMNLYEPTSGSVLIDQTDIRQIDPVDLRRSIGCVPQEPFLFMGTIKDNITIGEQYVTDEEILEASKAAGVHEFLGKHEAGYDLLVGERGEGLSGGERQAVTLARALITNPNIMILDEPTNSMDKQTENAFIKRMKNLIANQTVIMITHKMSILPLVDRVIVIDNGKIIADGPKDVVLKSKGMN